MLSALKNIHAKTVKEKVSNTFVKSVIFNELPPPCDYFHIVTVLICKQKR